MDFHGPNGSDRNPHSENILPSNRGAMCTLVGIRVKIHSCEGQRDTEKDEKGTGTLGRKDGSG